MKQQKNKQYFTGFCCTVLVLFGVMLPVLAEQTRYLMRFPDVHENTVVFVSGEDIWSVPVTGGIARRLTMHDGQERYPKFSPDGSLIAFSAEYDGNADVYVMNRNGGQITRVTYHPDFDNVVGWHPKKNKILFQSTRNSYNRFLRLFLISPDGTGLEELILHEASQGSFSPDGKQIAYNKLSRENRTWKRYRGGTAQEIYLYNFEKNSEKILTSFEGTDRIPMWIGSKIYFSSDRDRVLNLYSVHPSDGSIEQLTHHTEYDIRRPSMGGDQIVYELGGNLWILNTRSKQSKQIPVEIHMDAPEVRPYYKDVKGNLTGFDLSPEGNRAVLIARGEVFTVPKKEGPSRNLTMSSGARDKDAAWSPDGRSIAYISDKSGELNIYVCDPKGMNPHKKLTDFKDGYRHTLRWSPDSKKIAFADQTLSLFVLDAKSGKTVKVDKAEYENVDISLDVKPIYDFQWSPDSRYIAYSRMDADLVTKVYIFDLNTKKIHQVSDGLFNDFHPVFSRDGKHLFFISNRRFDPTYCDFEWELVYKKVAGIFAVSLTRDGKSILPLKSDEAVTETESTEKPDNKKDGKTSGKKAVDPGTLIEFDGIESRIEMLPLPRGNYRYLAANESSLFYLNADEGDYNRFEYRGPGSRSLYSFSFEKQNQNTVIENVQGYKLSADGKKIIYRRGNEVGILESGSSDADHAPVNFSDLKMWLDPRAEWKQIFNEAWRMERDFYYEPSMHGLDWNAMKKKYGSLLEFASCRQDIQYIIGELIGELNTSHTYVFGGDRTRQAQGVNTGMLGTDWQIDSKSGRYRFGKILRVADWTQGIIPPLAKPGIQIQKGDYLLSINGQDVTTDRNVYSFLQGQAGKQVALVVNSKPTLTGARTYRVQPVSREYTLRYLDWVEHNRNVVEQASNGKIGYLHLPDTYNGSAREFPKYFYAQTRKKGIIVDGRFNGGGLDPDIFLQRLNKKTLAYWTRRYSHDQTTPAVVTRAHMVCLTNRQAGSGGDMLPMEFQMHKMGPVIGTRTWGGLVGVSMFISLVDGGGLSAPDYRIYDSSGKWIVENEGVTPDIIVDLHPEEMSRGHDAQLMKGVEVLMKKIKDEPRTWPDHEPFPVDR